MFLPICTKFGTVKVVRKVIWHPSARAAVRGFPEGVKDEMGYLLFRLQKKDQLTMPHSWPMREVAMGAYELRTRGEEGIYRAFYYLKSRAGILVFHAFKKKTRKTPFDEINRGKKNLQEMLNG